MRTLLSALLLVILPAGAMLAQNSKPAPLPPQVQPRREILPGQLAPLPRSSTPPATNSGRRAPAAPPAQELGRNITLHFQGSLLGSIDLDLTLTGCGPQFSTDFARPAPEGTPAPIVTVSALVRETVGGLRVEYTLGVRVALETSAQAVPGGRVARNYEFRDLNLTGAVVVKAGVPIVLSKLGDKTLTLTMDELGKAE